jgi:acyl-CoA synthetase (AMP-forming)/AMP-acid ligase II
MTDVRAAAGEAARSYQGHGPREPIEPGAGLVSRLENWAGTTPDASWLTAVDAAGNAETFTFSRAADAVRRLAGWLALTLGAGPGATVAVLVSNDTRSALTVLAALRCGYSVFFISPADPGPRRAELLGALPLTAVLAPDPRATAQLPTAVPVPDPSGLPEPVTSGAPVPGGRLLFATSGSTAASKIVVQSEYAATMNAEALRRHHGLGPGARVLGCLPVCHVNGLHFTLLSTLWSGAEAVLLRSFAPARYRECAERFRPHIASVVPSILDQLVTGPRPDFGPQFRYFVSAAAPLSARTAANVLDKLGARVIQGYGLTETTNFSTMMPADLTDEEYRALMIDNAVPSVGTALFGNEVAVLRSDGSAAEPGESGEVCMRGHNVMLGYLDNPSANAEAFAGGWFHSGDLGYLTQDAGGRSFLVLTGRSKNIAKTLGFAVSLEEMERWLQSLPWVRDAACFAEPDRFRGEAVVAVVAADGGLDEDALERHLAAHFPPAVLPARYIHAETVPRTETGKILRRRLAQAHGSAAAVSRQALAATSQEDQ